MVFTIIASVVFDFLVSLWFLNEVISGNMEPFEFSPKNIYRYSKMNMFGCVVISLIAVALTLFYHVPAFIVWVVYKLFHIGRRK